MKPRNQATALVITLVLLMLLTGVAIAFFTQVNVEARAAKSFADSVTTKQLADSAVSAVMAQIREATTVKNGAWTSQPGMVKVFGAAQKTSDAIAGYYKLYSSGTMVLGSSDAAAFDPSTEVPARWNQQPALYTDLNEPVTRLLPSADGSGNMVATPRYPIIDPALADASVNADTQTGIPQGHKSSVIEGFQIDQNPAGQTDQNGQAQAPMPVQWLYVLRDGTLTAPTSVDSAGTTVKWVKATDAASAARTPSKDNPIVGRVAFWADDDTCRLNVNTAGGYCMQAMKAKGSANYDQYNYAGSFWDTPRMNTRFEVGLNYPDTSPNAGEVQVGGLARCQPAQGEYQRYPGHPMTTSLSVVFSDGYYDSNFGKGTLFRGSGWTLNMPSEILYKLTPRVAPGGSMGGMKRSRGGADKSGTIAPDTGALDPRYDRLYSSTDELMFAPPGVDTTNTAEYDYSKPVRTNTDDRLAAYVNENNSNPLISGQANASDLKIAYNKGSLTPNVFDKLRFFLTAHSRAPELNLFGRPRVTIWPVWDDSTLKKPYRTRHDNLFLFCSTLGAQPSSHIYEFYRNDPLSSTTDISLQHNITLLDYLRTLTSSPVPGYPASQTFAGKYAQGERDQILTEIFDYIRTVNLKDVNLDLKSTDTQYKYSQYAKLGLVVPSERKVNNVATKGLGRFPTITSANLVFYHAGFVGTKGNSTTEVTIDDTTDLQGLAFGDFVAQFNIKAMLMRAFVAFETFNPMEGYSPISGTQSGNNWVNLNCTFSGPWTVTAGGNTKPLAFRGGSKRIVSSGNYWTGRNFGGYEGILHTIAPAGSGETTSNYPYATPRGNAIRVDYVMGGADGKTLVPPPSFSFAGGTVKVVVGFGAQPVQTMTIPLPAASAWPIPSYRIAVTKPAGAGAKATGTIVDGIWLAPCGMGRFQDYWPQIKQLPVAMINTTGGGPNRTMGLESRLDWLLVGSGGAYSSGWINETKGDFGDRWRQIFQPGDTIRSVIADGAPGSTAADPRGGDHRISAIYNETGGTGAIDPRFRAHTDYMNSAVRQAENIRVPDGSSYFPPLAADQTKPAWGILPTDPSIATPTSPGYNTPHNIYNPTQHGNLAPMAPNVFYPAGVAADLERGINGVKREDSSPTDPTAVGDFDTGIGSFPDGAFGNKSDEGNVIQRYWDDYYQVWRYPTPYFYTWTYEPPGDTYFSPNRQVPSPFVFGSLPARGIARKGWETLCFNPTIPDHPGIDPSRGLKDHLLLDLFNMPVVEPYAISEPFSTAGKVNLNYQIMPFTYIHRSTALRGALQAIRVAAVPPSHVATYKTGFTSGIEPARSDFGTPVNYRMLIDRNETIRAIEGQVFQGLGATGTFAGKVFRTASEICERFFYPTGQQGLVAQYRKGSEADIQSWWKRNVLTGDNLREKPYSDLYSRVTTKSNTFTVYVRAQVLRPGRIATDADYLSYKDTPGSVFAEYRGESTIERYLDPQDHRFTPGDPEFINPDTDSIEPAFRFRTVYSKRFLP